MTSWVRLWHDMPTDPKWRAIAQKTGQRIGDIIAVFSFVLVNASCNTMKRGETHRLFPDDIGAAIDLPPADVEAILGAMIGKVMDKDGRLLGWEKRQPKREDSSTARVREHRERAARNTMKHAVTQRNAPDSDSDRNKNKKNGRSGSSGGARCPGMPQEEMLARFERRISKPLGDGAWEIIDAAKHRLSPIHAESLRLCKMATVKLGDGTKWPTSWRITD